MARLVAIVLAGWLCAGATGARTSAATDNAWLIVVDDLHVAFAQTGRLRDVLRKVATELIHEGDRYVFRATGPSAVSLKNAPLTDDRELASAAIKMITGNALKDSDILAARAGASAVNEVLYRANAALDAAEESLSALTTDAARRQAIVYISNGYDVETYPALAERVRRFARRARENNITIFPIDARGLETLSIPNSSNAWQDYTTATYRSLELMAEETGGFVMERPNAPAPELARISAQMR
jgi:VWFA-related protein